MKIAALENELRKLSDDDLEELQRSLNFSCVKLPAQLIMELGLRTLASIVAFVRDTRKEETRGKRADGPEDNSGNVSN